MKHEVDGSVSVSTFNLNVNPTRSALMSKAYPHVVNPYPTVTLCLFGKPPINTKNRYNSA